jgi:preprotein translocase subunit SecD
MRSAVCILLLLGGIATGCGAADQGSSSNHVVLQPSGAVDVTDDELDRAVEIIRARLDKLGVKDAKISREGGKVLLELPGPRRVALIPVLTRPGRLEFFDLQGDLAETSKDSNGFPRPSLAPLTAGDNTVLVTCSKSERYCPGVEEAPSRTYYYLFKYDPTNKEHPIPEMTGSDLKRTGTRQDFDTQTNQPVVLMQFTDSGADKFEDITRTLVERGRNLANQQGLPSGMGNDDANQQFAIVLDREMKSAPSVDFDDNPNGIPGNNGAQITAISMSDAKDLALVLRSGTLPWEFRIVSE